MTQKEQDERVYRKICEMRDALGQAKSALVTYFPNLSTKDAIDDAADALDRAQHHSAIRALEHYKV